MLTLVFLVCNTLSGECYSATSGVVYKNEASCKQDGLAILDRNNKLQQEGKSPPEKAIYYCINWGEPL